MKLPARLAKYLKEFELAAKAIQLAAHPTLDAALLAAICDRESGGGVYLVPKGPAGTGDKGHGHGLMQIDDRTWAPWLVLKDEAGVPLWQTPMQNILKGAQILRQGVLATQSVEGGICAYNAGPLAAKRALQAAGADAPIEKRIEALNQKTTGKNYVSSVIARAAEFRKE